MRILAPASNLADVKELIRVGAEDIYMGASSDVFSNYSYNGRSVRAKSGKLVSPPLEEIKEICDYVHMHSGQVYFLANTPFLYDGQDDHNLICRGFINYIGKAYDYGIDSLVLGDIGAVRLVKETFPDLKIVASSYLEVQNELSLKLLEDMGVSQVILSYQSTLEEIKALSEISNMDIEVFGHGGCSFYVGSCNMFHEMGEEPINIGYPCRALYHVTDKEQDYGRFRILDSFKMCSLCSLKDLMDCGVKALKLVGRDLNAGYMLQLVQIYRQAIDRIRQGEEAESICPDLPLWWQKAWCEAGLCKYKVSFKDRKGS